LGLSLSKSAWVQFLDADDELLPGKIEGQMALVSRDTPFVVGNSVHVFSDGRKHLRKSDRDVWKGLIRSKLGDTCANLWNRQFLVEVGAWDERLASSQEYDLMFRLVCRNPNVVFDGRYLTLIHKTENSISTSPEKRALRIDNWLKLRERIRQHLLKEKKFDLKKRYFWSGAVGQFCREYGVHAPLHVQRFFFWFYRIELSLKKKVNHILKSRV
jgi:glycosyltransferase involved in cell wall biosynthesis